MPCYYMLLMEVSTNEQNFKLGDHDINVVSEYTYLGVCYPCNNNLGKGIILLKNQACTVQITFIFIGQTRLVFGNCVCTCATKHSNISNFSELA